MSPTTASDGAGTSLTWMIKAPCYTAVAVFARRWRKPHRTPGAGHNTAPRKIPFKKVVMKSNYQLEGRHGQPSSGLINNRTCPALEGVSLFSELKGCDKPSQQEETGTTSTNTPLPQSLKPQWVRQGGSPRQRPQHPRRGEGASPSSPYTISCKVVRMKVS